MQMSGRRLRPLLDFLSSTPRTDRLPSSSWMMQASTKIARAVERRAGQQRQPGNASCGTETQITGDTGWCSHEATPQPEHVPGYRVTALSAFMLVCKAVHMFLFSSIMQQVSIKSDSPQVNQLIIYWQANLNTLQQPPLINDTFTVN